MKAKLYLPPLFFLFLFTLITPVLGADPDINITTFPSQLASAWGIDTFSAGLFLSMIIGLAVFLPFALLRVKGIILLFIGFSYMGFLVAIAWLPYWIPLITCLLIGALYGSKFKGMI